MVAPIQAPNSPVDLIAWAREGSAETEVRGRQGGLDALRTHLVPQLEEPAEERQPRNLARATPVQPTDGAGLNPPSVVSAQTAGDMASRFVSAPPGGTVSHPPAGGHAFNGAFGLSEEALSRLEAGLRAQRDQRTTAPAQIVQKKPALEAFRGPDANLAPQRFIHLPMSLILLAAVITMFVVYYLSGGSIAVLQSEPASEAIEPARTPGAHAAVQLDQRASTPVSNEPLPSTPVQAELHPSGPIAAGLPSQAVVPVMQITSPSEASAQNHPHGRKKHPAKRSISR
jgi:hypothetical protein